MTNKKSKKKEKKLTSKQLQREILRLFKENPKKRLNPRQVAKRLNVANNKDSILYAMEKLTESRKLNGLEDYKFMYKKSAGRSASKKWYTGVVDMTRSGAGYIVSPELPQDVYVSAKNLNTALHGDEVKVSIWSKRKGGRVEGEVMKIVKRVTDHFIGTVHLSDGFAFVVPDKSNMPVDIYVDLKNLMKAKDGEKVVVAIENWNEGKSNKNPEGVVTEVLGKAGGNDIEMKAILLNNGFVLDFPKEALAEAKRMDESITPEEVAIRRDLRAVTTFTIDPEDAKDFDDALSLEYLPNGHYEVGVHIADVTHFLKTNTPLDKEAFSRSTSVYLVDRVLPMLPERLSNELCSLRPKEDKYTFSAIFEFDKNDKMVKRWFGKTLIHSDRRFTYEEAQEVLDKGKGEMESELKKLNMLAHRLRKDRFKKGSIDFDSEEVRFRLDEDGKPLEVYVKERKDTHKLIEEFMLLANREVAAFIHEKGKGHEIPFVYRVHDEPNEERVVELAAFAKEMGFEMNVGTPEDIARSFNKLAKAAQREPGLRLLEPIAIRTMAKAAYTTENIGHYGLGFDNYTHFTSPIRRYSDVLVHRLLEANLHGNTFRTGKDALEESCRHISKMERRAMDAERESVKYKQVEYMEQHVGDEFTGRISGMIDRGLFVELTDSKCEGMVGFDTFNEPFEIEDGRLRAIGMRSKRVLKMGDEVQVRVIDTDREHRTIELEMVD